VGEATEVPPRSPGRGLPYWNSRVLRRQALGEEDDGQGRWVQDMVFGDFLNDLEMMDAATYSFAMANAHPLLKEQASWVAPTNNANGVVRTIRIVLGLG